MTSIKETVGFLGRVILIRVGGLVSDAASRKVQSLEKELADMSSDLEIALSAAEAFAERMEALQELWDSPHHHEECELRWVRAEAELERVRGALEKIWAIDRSDPLAIQKARGWANYALSSGPAPEAGPGCVECGREGPADHCRIERGRNHGE